MPRELVEYLVAHRAVLVPEMQQMWVERGARTQGSWTEMFGPGAAAEEVFTAWHYARFANALAEAGKAEYAMPLYVNVALNRPGRAPGEYPSGGPLPHLIDVWKAGAPAIDFLAPDIYFPNFVDIIARYTRSDNPLSIPEALYASNPQAPANALFAFGEHDAIGYGPFSIEWISEESGALGSAYEILRQLSPYILAAQGSDRIAGFKPRLLYDETVVYEPQVRRIGDFRLTVAFADIQRPVLTPETGGYGGIVIQVDRDEYLIAGQGLQSPSSRSGMDLRSRELGVPGRAGSTPRVAGCRGDCSMATRPIRAATSVSRRVSGKFSGCASSATIEWRRTGREWECRRWKSSSASNMMPCSSRCGVSSSTWRAGSRRRTSGSSSCSRAATRPARAAPSRRSRSS